MPIKYALFGKNITSDSDDYAAMVQIGGSADGADLAQDIIDQGSTMNEPGILAWPLPTSWPAGGGSSRPVWISCEAL